MCSMPCLLPLLVHTVPGPWSPVPGPPPKINPKGVYPMESNVFDGASLTSTCSHCPRSPVPCPRSPFPPKKSNRKGLYPKDSNVFDAVSLTSTCPTVPGPWSLVPGPPSLLKKLINPKGVYPMESNVFDVASRTSIYLFSLSPVPGPLSPVPCPPLKNYITLKVCIQWSPMCSMLCLLPLLVPTVPHPWSPVPCPP